MYNQNRMNQVHEDFLTEETTIILASKTKRWFAAAIDYFILSIIFAVLVYSFGTTEVDFEGNVSRTVEGFPGFLVSFGPWFVLLPLMEVMLKGRTIGKSIFRLRSANLDGSEITTQAAILRHLVDFVDYLPFFGIVGLIVASNSAQKRRVGDLVGKTIVVQE